MVSLFCTYYPLFPLNRWVTSHFFSPKFSIISPKLWSCKWWGWDLNLSHVVPALAQNHHVIHKTCREQESLWLSPDGTAICICTGTKPAPILGHSRFSFDYQVLWQTIGFMFHFLMCCSALIWEPCFRSQMWFFLRSNWTNKWGPRYPKIFSLQLCESILTYSSSVSMIPPKHRFH